MKEEKTCKRTHRLTRSMEWQKREIGIAILRFSEACKNHNQNYLIFCEFTSILRYLRNYTILFTEIGENHKLERIAVSQFL